jgi:hypothetical protein
MTIAACGEQIIRIKHASFQWDQRGDINGDGLANAEADRWRISTLITNQRLIDSVLRGLI